MSDRSSAGIFAMVFKLLAKNPTSENKAEARKFFKKSMEHDFSPYQMYADKACLALGIARKGVDPDYPDDGVRVLWPGDNGFEQAEEKGAGMKTVEHKIFGTARKITYDDSDQAKQAVFDAVLAFFFKHNSFSGECIQQSDEPILDAPSLVSTIADDILKFQMGGEEE